MANPTTTTIAGTKYEMKLLGGRDTRTVGLIVTSAVLRGLAVAMAKADLEKIVKGLQDKTGQVTEESVKAKGPGLLDSLSMETIQTALGGLAEGGAAMVDHISPAELEVLVDKFTEQTTVYLRSEHQDDPNVYPTPLKNREDHWSGKWPQFLQWLVWGVRANGFFGDWVEAIGRSRPATGTAGAQASPGST